MPQFHVESERKKRKSLTNSVPQQSTPQLSSATIQRATSDVSSLSPQEVMGLQRSIGNRAVQTLLSPSMVSPITVRTSRPTIQPKLQVGPVNDPYEREADRVAQEVVSHPAVSLTTVQRNVKDGDFISRKLGTDVIQREGESEDEFEEEFEDASDSEFEGELEDELELTDEENDYRPSAKEIRRNMGVKFPLWFMAVHGAKTIDKARSKISGRKKTGLFNRAARGAGMSAIDARSKASRKHHERGLSRKERRRLAKDRKAFRRQERRDHRAFKRKEHEIYF